MDANRTTSRYALSDELARFCLPEANRDPNRKLAWTNSVCLLFLLIGFMGARSAANFTEPPPRVEEAIPTIIEPLKPTPTSEVQKVQPTDQNPAPAPRVVAVTIDTPAINFAVPTIGNVVVANALARAPVVQRLTSLSSVQRVSSTGDNGDRPQPPYPAIALSEAEQGSVGVTMTVDDSGTVTQIDLKESSGYPILDRSTLEFIKRHWHIQPLAGSHVFETTITFKIAVN
jgi:TonB family protein